MDASADYETKARHLRALYRRRPPWQQVRDEYERLFGESSTGGALEHIVRDAWIEARKLAGWGYRTGAQAWFRADGSRVVDDDGSEWAHL